MFMSDELSPGEANTRRRKRRQMQYLIVATIMGFAIGFSASFFDEGDGGLFTGDWENLSLPPEVAIGLAVAILFGFLAMPLWGFTRLDDYKREHNYIAFTGGMLAALAGFPIWAVLYAGGFAPPPHAFGVWCIGFFAMFAAYGYAYFTR